MNAVSPETRNCARTLIARRLGLRFTEHRDAELERALVHAAHQAGAADVRQYVGRLGNLAGDAPEWQQLASRLTVGETYFMRDERCFDALEREVLAPLIERRRGQGVRHLRIWSAGCATGEEPYSIAMVLDRLLPDRADWSLTILGTDVDAHALWIARHGRYRSWSLRATPAWMRERYFLPRSAGSFELDPAIRRMVSFAPLNLASDAYPSPAPNTTGIDLILCRNVLMYFTAEAQAHAVDRLKRALADGGVLVLAPAEASIELLRPLRPVDAAGAILYRKDSAAHGPRTARRAPLPAAAPQRRLTPAAPNRPPVRSLEPGPPLLAQARAEADRGNLEQAHRLCRAAVAQDRLDVDAYLLLAVIERERGQLGAAVEAIRRAIYLSPESAPAHFVLGNLLLAEGKASKARQSMATVVELLDGVSRDHVIPHADGLAAGRVLETARGYLEDA